MELYNTCARLIERGKTNGMQRKLEEKLKEQGNA